VVEESRLFLREDHDPSCPISEALEQDCPPLVMLPVAPAVPHSIGRWSYFFGDRTLTTESWG
jgi:hypothetical protein